MQWNSYPPPLQSLNDSATFSVARSYKLGRLEDFSKDVPKTIASSKEKYECTRDAHCTDYQKCAAEKCRPVCEGVTCGVGKECIYTTPHTFVCRIIDPCRDGPCPADYPVCTSEGRMYTCSPCPRGTANFGNGECRRSVCTTEPYAQDISGGYSKFCTEHFIYARYMQPDDMTLRLELMDTRGPDYPDHSFAGFASGTGTDCRCGFSEGRSGWHYSERTTHVLPKGSRVDSLVISAGRATGCNSWEAKTIRKGQRITLTECEGYGTQEADISYHFRAEGERTYGPANENKFCVDGMCSDQP